MGISLEQDRLFQLEQHKAHLHINVSVVEEASAGHQSKRASSRSGDRCGHSHKIEKGLQREICTSKNHSLGVYRQIMPCQGNENGLSLFLLA